MSYFSKINITFFLDILNHFFLIFNLNLNSQNLISIITYILNQNGCFILPNSLFDNFIIQIKILSFGLNYLLIDKLVLIQINDWSHIVISSIDLTFNIILQFIDQVNLMVIFLVNQNFIQKSHQFKFNHLSFLLLIIFQRVE